jgi:outer membrane protein OmpA-like peptidoglycan-associated protein
MTLTLMRALALWSGGLALMIISGLPLSQVDQAMAMAGTLGLVAGFWLLAGRRSARLGGPLLREAFRSLPGSECRLPVVLVCGEGSTALFAADADADSNANPAEPTAVRTTPHACYVGVSAIARLPDVVAALLADRPHWRDRLNVMFVVNPAQHADTALLAAQIRVLDHQLSVVRRHALALPLWVVSYQQVSQGPRDVRGSCFSQEAAGSSTESQWFSWENGQPTARVRHNGTCVNVEDWQREDAATLTQRMRIAVQINTHAAWLAQCVAPHFTRIGRHRAPSPVAYAICRVASLPDCVPDSLWQRWIQAKTALVPTSPVAGETGGLLPVPDGLLELLPRHTDDSAARRASVIGVWLTALAAVVAMSSSARQNTLLIRQVSDDLRRYTAFNESVRDDQQARARREAALNALHEDARRLDDYYRYGEPRWLGLGLYRADPLRIPVWEAIGSYRPVAEAPVAEAVRLDTLSLFNVGSAELKSDSTQVLVNALVDIKARPGWLIVVTGHTDASGNPEQNLRLSRDRAASVRDWMQRMGGIPGSCFAVQGFGASQPVASNDTEQGRRANRRVDIRLVPQEGACGALSAGAGQATSVAFRGIR